MRKIKVIGLHGDRQAGKDTFLQNLNKADEKNSPIIDRFRRLAFADKLKEDLYEVIMDQFGWDSFNLTQEQKEIVRPIWIAYGNAWRKINPLHWVKKVDSDIVEMESIGCEYIYTISDVRFSNEAEYFKKKYKSKFLLIDIVNPNGPEPTPEEQIYGPEVKKLVDYTFSCDKVDQLEYFTADFYNKYIFPKI